MTLITVDQLTRRRSREWFLFISVLVVMIQQLYLGMMMMMNKNIEGNSSTPVSMEWRQTRRHYDDPIQNRQIETVETIPLHHQQMGKKSVQQIITQNIHPNINHSKRSIIGLNKNRSIQSSFSPSVLQKMNNSESRGLPYHQGNIGKGRLTRRTERLGLHRKNLNTLFILT